MLDQDIQIAEARAAGATLQEIASLNGFHESTACRKLQKPDIKKHIEEIQARIANTCYSQAADNITFAINQYPKQVSLKDKKDSQLFDHSWKGTLRILESIGILPSHAPSVFIQQVLTNNTIINNDISGLISKLYGAEEKSEVIEIDYDREG